MTGPWPHKPFTFRALRKTFGAMWVRCDVCRRYAPLSIGGLQDVDYRSKIFSCSRCGSEAYLAVIEPINEAGMQDYRLDAIERPERHPTAAAPFALRGGIAFGCADGVGLRCACVANSQLPCLVRWRRAGPLPMTLDIGFPELLRVRAAIIK